MDSRRTILKKAGVTGAAVTAGLAGCLGSDSDSGGDGESDTVSAAYVYNEEVTEIGWTATHERVRTNLEEELDWYDTQYVEAVSPTGAADTFRTLAREGVDVIEACTFDYGTPAAEVVQEVDDIYIETPRMIPVDTYEGEQLGYYLGKLEDACYATGVAAGMLTETNVLGYVMPFSIASTVTELNALMQGVKSVNEDATMVVRFTDSWYDPPAEREAAEALVEQDADVLGYRVSTPTTLEVAAENDLWGYGYADSFTGTDIEYDKYITSRMWDWDPFYRQTAEAARDGSTGNMDRFNVDDFRGNYFGFAEGGVTLDDYGSAVPSDVADAMDEAVEQLSSGELTGEEIFDGTIYSGDSAYERVSSASEYVDGIDA